MGELASAHARIDVNGLLGTHEQTSEDNHELIRDVERDGDGCDVAVVLLRSE